jgi:hypothetical protein
MASAAALSTLGNGSGIRVSSAAVVEIQMIAPGQSYVQDSIQGIRVR